MFRSPSFPSHVTLPTDRTLIMGVLNVTPDSFSDGGKWLSFADAVSHAEQLCDDGADIIDVGGESTRPGSARITANEEQQRIGAVVDELVRQNMVVSVDTVHASTARIMADRGAAIINDVSGACWDSQMAATMATIEAAVVIQHWRGFPGSASERVLDEGALATVIDDLRGQLDTVYAAGVSSERIIIDPGLGFAKTVDASWDVFAGLPALHEAFSHPVLIGASRKRFIQSLATDTISVDDLTAATTVLSALHGAWAVRVHAPKRNTAAIAAARAWVRGTMRNNNGQ
ncbi:MAG: dihydropteroate synthase [Actinomycetaceae bacterium]|nr:dihydropteroate synthase [Actinomycetaceae bacterium]